MGWMILVLWYVFALWALPKLARMGNNGKPLTPEQDGAALLVFWVLSPVSLPAMLAFVLGEATAKHWRRCYERVVSHWLRLTGTDK